MLGAYWWRVSSWQIRLYDEFESYDVMVSWNERLAREDRFSGT